VTSFARTSKEEVRHVSERYISKSDPFIVMVSTPNAPGGLYEKIERESFDTCIYKKISLDYNYGLDKIYTKAEIDKAKASPSFEREYCLKYLGLIGNVFSQQSLDNATKIGYNPPDKSKCKEINRFGYRVWQLQLYYRRYPTGRW
jgi:hypothetical protein